MRDSLARFNDWRRRLTDELAALPDTLQSIRAGATNFDLVSQRLAASTKTLEDVTNLYEATMASSARRSAETADVLRQRVERVVSESPERVTATMRESMKEMQRTAEALAELNPLWSKRVRSQESK